MFSRDEMRKVAAADVLDVARELVEEAKVIDVVPPEGYQALAAVVQAMHDTLVAAGALEPGAVADTLSRMRTPDEKFNGFLAAFIGQLREMPFKPVSVREQLRVVEGKDDDDE